MHETSRGNGFATYVPCLLHAVSLFNSWNIQDGTRIQSMNISGPSVWVTCVRGREKQAVGELYDLFEQVSVCIVTQQ